MNSLMRTTCVAVVALLAAACGDISSTAPADATLTTDSPAYVAQSLGGGRYSVTVVTTLRNRTTHDVSLPTCGSATTPSYTVELITPSNSDGAAYNPSYACTGGGQPLVVRAGDTRVDTLTLTGPNSVDSSGHPIGVLAGAFRLHFGDQASNPFTISLP